MRIRKDKALLVLEDGKIFEGKSIGAKGEAIGEVVFNTSITGYQEILTDPSYKGQIVTLTYTQIGNYGINEDDIESFRPFVEGLIIREGSRISSNWRSKKTLHDYLVENGIVGIEGIDTRALTRHIRDFGAMQGIISTEDFDPLNLIKKVKNAPGLVGRDLVCEVTCKKAYNWESDLREWKQDIFSDVKFMRKTYNVVVYDYGVKYNILRILRTMNCNVTVVPANTAAEEVLSLRPDGVLLSNGPGDPEGVPYAIENVEKLIGKIPIFGICLGHQIIALALGGRTYKLKFGHHGGNHPVMDLERGKINITCQNHGFAVDIYSFLGEGKDYSKRVLDTSRTEFGEVILTHLNLNDHTVEGIRHKRYPLVSVQFHPESSPGPHDALYIFKDFIDLMEKN